MSRRLPLVILVATSALASLSAVSAADSSRQETVRARSPDVMPFDMARTTHVFTKSPSGGVQRVFAKDGSDDVQTSLVRMHLKHLAAQFEQRDFSGPSHVHGQEMPGLAALRTAAPTDLRVRYRDVAAGGELEYFTEKPALVTALHQWFDAQVSDHGMDAMAGHDHSTNRP
jgi:hypothetical protein